MQDMRCADAVGGRPIRVMQVIERLPLAGAETLLVTLARNLNPARFHLTVCCLAGEGRAADWLRKHGVRVVTVDGYGGHPLRKISAVFRVMRAQCPDIVQTHLVEANLWGRIGARLARIPVVCKTEHGGLRSSWEKGTPGGMIRAVADEVLDRFSDCIIYVSEAQRNELTRGRYDPASRIVVYNAVDDRRFMTPGDRAAVRQRYGFDDATIVVGSVGRLVQSKGHEYLLEAVALVRKQYPAIQVMLVGIGPAEGELKERARALDVPVMFTGEREDVPELMGAMDVFVHSSVREPFGICVAEAMFVGLPVIATRVGGLPEIVAHGETGLLVPPADAKALAHALQTLIARPVEARRIAERGRQFARCRFDGPRYARDMEGIYVALVERRQNRSGTPRRGKLPGAV